MKIKRRLVSYRGLETVFFGDSHEFPYILTLEETRTSFSFLKLKKVTKTVLKEIKYTISMFQSIREHKDHWDKMIETRQHIT